MNHRHISILAAGCLTIMAAQMAHAGSVVSWSKEANGILVKRTDGATRLQVYTPDAIRVLSGADAGSLQENDLALTAKPQSVKWQVKEDGNAIHLLTQNLDCVVDRSNGRVRFEKADNVIASEEDGDAGKTIKQSFTLVKDEAIYGSGQHQNGFMNLRNKNVHLEQVNREVAIPVIVSSRGYGILWNNAAGTDINQGYDVSLFDTIPSSNLYDKSDHPGGLTAQYYQGRSFETLKKEQVDPVVDFEWNGRPIDGVEHENFSVRWSGSIQADKAGIYMVSTDSDDGVRLWIDGHLVIDNWTDHAPTIDTAICDFKANSRHTVKMEYYQGEYGAVARLKWRNAGSSQNTQFCFNSETGKCIDYFFLNGPKLDNVIHQYRLLTGKAPMLPKWAYGYWQSKERYNTQDELLSIGRQYREKQLPIDCIVQDWFYWTPYPQGSHKFDEKRYPDIAATLKQLHEDNFHIMLSVWAKFDPGSENFDALTKAGYLYPSDWGRGFYDAFSAKAGALYWKQINEQLYTKGFDGWWLDASEPELDMNAFRGYTTAAGKGAEVLNAYPLEHTGNVYHGQRQVTNDKRVVILTRSAYTGQQRNSAITWSGDITASWKVFADQIPAGLNFNLCGIPYWTTDTGGFFVSYPEGCDNPEYRELYARWFQFSTFCPVFRSHGTNTPREMWQFGSDIQQVLLKYDTLRYRMLPYIYSLAGMVTQDDYTMMRALPMDFPSDVQVRHIADQFMFGTAFMACPVIQYQAANRSVYLPKGSKWIDFWTGSASIGGKTVTVPTPVDTMPLFVKAGSIVPLGPTMQYATQKKEDPIELRIYPGANGSFTLYEDENDGYAYEQGSYTNIAINWNDKSNTLTIGKRQGSFPGMLSKRTFRIVVVKPGHGVGEEATSQVDKVVEYDGNKVDARIAL